MEFNLPEGIKGLIFDLDGTLADTMPYHMQAWKDACESFGMEMSSDFLRTFTGSPGINIAKAIIKKYGKEDAINPDQIADRKKENFANIQHRVSEVKPVADIVRNYHGKIPMSVGTGGHSVTVERTLEVIGMKDYFEIIVTADNVSSHKPDPETFLKCAELMKVDPESILVFEDGDLGIEAAARAGMKSVDVRSWYDYSW
ncbi:MAG: beta-phosphoglucomutase family hydrolase [Bacteroidales bacterium]|nr:beta-phosphoglucomutase family hydrolase [Bacteroidales bacterium]